MQESARVAIIDDEESIRRALLRLFRFANYEAEAFASASAFLESYDEGRRPDCIVLDLKMPGMSGLDLLRHLAALGNAPPVIVITADGGDCVEDECMRLGSKRYFQKPVDGRALIESVRGVIG
jgi:two-component system response regulator FixJ